MVKYTAIGIMSGTSLDGVDLAGCEFSQQNGKWAFKILAAETIPYNEEWLFRMQKAHLLSGLELSRLNVEYGRFLGRLAYDFIFKHHLNPAIIASHGHTIFHQPSAGLTLQIGSGAEIAAQTRTTVVCDFRSLDVALGGQGAPLVPIGDRLLFADYRFCLNIGGFANISFEENGRRIAFDVCPANFVLNFLMGKMGKSYDEDGKIAASGKVIPELSNQLNHLGYYHQNPPKSLGREWVEANILSLFSENYHLPDLLRTIVEHIAHQVSEVTKHHASAEILVTGGGAKNEFLMERISASTNHKVIIPEKMIIDYKEALVFAFLGVLRILQQPNCLASVTGAGADNVGGAVYTF